MDGTGSRVPIRRWAVLRLIEMSAVGRQLQVHARRIKDIFNTAEIDVLDAPAQRPVSKRRAVCRQTAPIVEIQDAFPASISIISLLLRDYYLKRKKKIKIKKN